MIQKVLYLMLFIAIRGATGQMQCIVCDESQNPDCRYLLNDHQAVVCPPAPDETTGCFRYESNNNVIRGCVSELVGTPRLQECQAGVICKICHTNGCNAKVDFQRCYNCNSGIETDCLRVQNDTRPVHVCNDYMDSCVQIIQDWTRLTIRGCTKEVDALHYHLETLRQTCVPNFCNSGIYPVWRRTCHQCDSVEGCNGNTTETPEFLLPCKIFWQDDECYSVLRNQQAARGCMSDNDANVAYCEASDICEICINPGCNFRPAVRPAEIHCVTCWGDPLCDWGITSPILAGQCIGDVWMGEVERCYTGVGPGGNVARGCTLSPDFPCPSNYSCSHCNTNRCNGATVRRQQCIRCRSNTPGQESCAESAEGLEQSECSGNYQTYQERGCYTMRKPNGIVIRGCFRDLSYDDQIKCYPNSDEFCATCLEDGCNIDPAPATANIQHPLYFIIFFSAIIRKFL